MQPNRIYCKNKKRHPNSTLLVLLGCLFIFACNDSKMEQVLPDMPVRATLNLNDAEYIRLQNIGEAVEITSPRGSFNYIGVGGLLIVHSIMPFDDASPFAAYDLYCPYCYYRTTNHPRVKAAAGGISAQCPTCMSKYDISSGFGGCIEGNGKRLQAYRTTYSHAMQQLSIKN